MGKEELRWSVQNMPVQEWRGTQRESLGDVLCVSKVKLQHLPFQVGHISGEQPPFSMDGAASAGSCLPAAPDPE